MRRFTIVAALSAALAIGSALPAFGQPPENVEDSVEELCRTIVDEHDLDGFTDCNYFD